MPKAEMQPNTKDKSINILYIEDVDDLRDSTVLGLEVRGYKVDPVATPRDAVDLLEPNKYQLAIIDIDFSPFNGIQGDDFIAKSSDYLGGTQIIAYTGVESKIKDKNRDLFRRIISKGHGDTLFEEVAEVNKEFQKSEQMTPEKDNKENTDDLRLKLFTKQEIETARKELMDEFKKVSDQKKKLVFYDGKEYSAEDLIKEIENDNSEVGRKQILLMLELNNSQRGENK